MPVTAGLAYAYWETGALHLVPALVVLFLTGLTLLGAAYLDDYFDHRSGVDAKVTNRTLFSGGSGLLQTGEWKPQTMLLLGIAAFGTALFFAIWLALAKANGTLAGLYAFGILSGILYAAPPVSAAYRGWGELLMAINFGPTASELGYATQAGSFSFPLLPVSLVFSGLILVVHLVHELLDYEADKAAKKSGWVVRWGKEKNKKLVSVLLIAPYPLLVLLVELRFLPLAALLPLATAAWGIGLAIKINREEEQEKIFTVLSKSFLLYVVFGMLLALGLVLDAWM